jgi:catechol 2,3-dioxygenase
VGHIGWRADSPEALEDVVRIWKASVQALAGMNGDMGHGKAYRFKSPEGHVHEVFWDVVWLKETGDKKSIYADRYASNRRFAANPRRFDHITYMAAKFKYAEEKNSGRHWV